MQYMGGKFRQAPAIVDALRPYIDGDTTYVEPFLGGANSAARVARELHPGKMILSDIIRPLVLFHERCYNEGVEWLPLDVSREEYDWYKENRPQDDPLTAWIGLGYQLFPDWFHSYATYKTMGYKNEQRRCMAWLHGCDDVEFVCSPYDELEIPDGAVVYCDPPYADSDAIKYAVGFDHDRFWNWVRELSRRCVVVCSTFYPPEDFVTLYDWGDTRPVQFAGTVHARAERPTTEKLIRYEGGLW